MRSPSLIVLSALVAAVYGAWGSRNAADKVRLSDIRALTLHSGEYTTGRRSSPVPQTKCTGGDACHLYEPDVIQCTNAGSDGRDVQWKCEAEMEDYYRFGKVTVTCEGYDHRNDPFVLAGSCGVEYALHLTDKGARAQSRADRGAYDKYRRFNDASHNYRQRKQTKSRSTMAPLSEQAEGASWVMVFVVMFALWAVVQYFRRPIQAVRQGYNAVPRNGGGGGGGGGGFRPRHDDAPPPPYAPEPSAPPPSPPMSGPFQEEPSCRPSATPQPHASASASASASLANGPGFWGGLAAGSALGYMASRGGQTESRHRPAPAHNEGSSSHHFSSHHNDDDNDSPQMRTTAGYGGTERR